MPRPRYAADIESNRSSIDSLPIRLRVHNVACCASNCSLLRSPGFLQKGKIELIGLTHAPVDVLIPFSRFGQGQVIVAAVEFFENNSVFGDFPDAVGL